MHCDRAEAHLPPIRQARTTLRAGDAWRGSVDAATALAIVLTLGLLACAPLGADAARIGIPAAMAAVIAGGLVYALLGSTAVPAGCPSSATTRVYAGLVARLASDPSIQVGRPADLTAIVAVCSVCVMLMGAAQLTMTSVGLHRLARLVPQPVLAGFMNGVALLIVLAQVPPMLGLPPLTRLWSASTLTLVQPWAPAIGLMTAAIVWLSRWKIRRVPATMVGLIVGTLVYWTLAHLLPTAHLSGTVEAMPGGMVSPDALRPLLSGEAFALLQRHVDAVCVTAAVLALVGTIESLLAAVVADQLSGTRHDSKHELRALGCANLVSGLCGGLPLVLMRARAVLLINDGVRGRAVPIAAALAFALIYGLGNRLVGLLPKAVLAGIMLTIAIALIDGWSRRVFGRLRAGDRSPDLRWSLAIVAIVCACTVLLGFAAAIMAGSLLSVGVFLFRMNRSLLRASYTAAQHPSRRAYAPEQERLLQPARPRIRVLELEGALFFGSTERLVSEVDRLPINVRVLVLDLRRVTTIDESGAVTLEQLSPRLKRHNVALLLAGLSAEHDHGRRLRTFGCFQEQPRDDWFRDADMAIEAGERILLAEAGVPRPQAVIALADCGLLHGLDDGRRARVLQLMTEQQLPAGTTLFRQGDHGDCLYVLTRGSMSMVGGGGHRYVSYFPGMLFGETAMLDGLGRSADALADTDSVVHALSLESIDRLAAADPDLGRLIMRNLALHLADRLRAASSAWEASAR